MSKEITLKCPKCGRRFADHVCFTSEKVELAEELEAPEYGIRIKCKVCKTPVIILFDNSGHHTRILLAGAQPWGRQNGIIE